MSLLNIVLLLDQLLINDIPIILQICEFSDNSVVVSNADSVKIKTQCDSLSAKENKYLKLNSNGYIEALSTVGNCASSKANYLCGPIRKSNSDDEPVEQSSAVTRKIKRKKIEKREESKRSRNDYLFPN